LPDGTRHPQAGGSFSCVPSTRDGSFHDSLFLDFAVKLKANCFIGKNKFNFHRKTEKKQNPQAHTAELMGLAKSQNMRLAIF